MCVYGGSGLILTAKTGQIRSGFSSSPYQRGRTARVIFFLHLKKWARKNPETVAVSGFSGKLSFSLAQYGCGDRI
jgi:hypothetical protein